MITHRNFKDDNDKLAMGELARRYNQEHLHIIDLPYRLSSWALDNPDNACLWEDEQGNLLGWAVMQTPFWTLDCSIDQQHPELYPEVLAWADQRAREALNTPDGLPRWYVNVFKDQTERIWQLEQAGFACQAEVGEDSWSKVWMRRPGNLPVKQYRLPPGFTVRSLAGKSEAEAYVELHQSVFESKNMTTAWRQRTLRHPDYTPDLDVVVTASDGRLAAFCIGWLCHNGENQSYYGQIEPLGCHADYRRYALGRLALAEVLRRMQEHGVKYVHVETDSYRDTAFRLYESLGFEVIRDVLIFRKDYA